MGWWNKKVRDLTGITAREEALEAEEMKLLKKKDPKEYATRRKEPWVNVLAVSIRI